MSIKKGDINSFKLWILRIIYKITREASEYAHWAFSEDVDAESDFVTSHRIAALTQVYPEYIDMCVNSCVAFSPKTKYEFLTICPKCGAERYMTPGSKVPRKIFVYLPIIPRLQGFYQSPEMINRLRYLPDYVPEEGVMKDVMDSEWFKHVCSHPATVDGVPLKHLPGTFPTDMFVSVAMDGALVNERNRRKGPSATPILAQVLNLPPQIRSQIGWLICLGIIPGPFGPEEKWSFLAPFEDEVCQLMHGIWTADAITGKMFMLRLFHILCLGDMRSIEKQLGLKGASAFKPCRHCEITGVRYDGTVYYCPLWQPVDDDGNPRKIWEPEELFDMLRTDEKMRSTATRIDALKEGSVARESEEFYSGLNALPAYRRTNTISRSKSYSLEWFHLFLENVIKNLIRFWKGNFHDLDEGTGCYELSPETWEKIGQETAAASPHIPSSFIRDLKDINIDADLYNAEAYGFWFMYLGPHLLQGRFKDEKYYVHACELAKIMEISLQWEITSDEIDQLEKRLWAWVKDYEK